MDVQNIICSTIDVKEMIMMMSLFFRVELFVVDLMRGTYPGITYVSLARRP